MTVSEWWDSTYPFRIAMDLTTLRNVAPGHPISISLPRARFVDLGKVRSDFADLRVLAFESGTWIETIPRAVVDDGENLTITFDSLDPIVAGEHVVDLYFIYFGNPNATLADEYTPNDWPIHVAATDAGITYTRPSEDWVNGESEKNQATASLVFYGPQVRMISDIGPLWGICEVRVDSGQWYSVDLFSAEAATNQVVYTQTGLPHALHTLQIRCAGRSNPSAGATTVNVRAVEYKAFIDVANTSEELAPNLFWTSVVLAGE